MGEPMEMIYETNKETIHAKASLEAGDQKAEKGHETEER
jgi:hypothetical protein